MAVAGAARQPAGSRRAVAAAVPAGAVADAARAPLRRVGVAARSRAGRPPDRLARGVRGGLGPRVRVAGAARRLRGVRVGVLLFGGAAAAVRRVAHHVVPGALCRKQGQTSGRAVCRRGEPSPEQLLGDLVSVLFGVKVEIWVILMLPVWTSVKGIHKWENGGTIMYSPDIHYLEFPQIYFFLDFCFKIDMWPHSYEMS